MVPLRRSALTTTGLFLAGELPNQHQPRDEGVSPQPHAAPDGLAVVNQPDGYGVHIWLDTDTAKPGSATALECRPGAPVQRQW